MEVIKPWGKYIDIFRTDNVVFKKLIIMPGECISYQSHNERDETWYIASGTGLFKTSMSPEPLRDYTVETLEQGMLLNITRGIAHQVINDGSEDIVIFEMQSGDCREEDITRYEDKYKR